jgi:serine/threonine-protein kinase HipA
MNDERRLILLLFGAPMGELTQAANGRLGFQYAADWLAQGPEIPLSLSFPLSNLSHEHGKVSPYLWGLLPDNADILNAIARDASEKTSPRNPFALLREIGEDCAGAVQFVRPERLDLLEGDGSVDWLDEAGVADALRRAKRGLPPRGKGSKKGKYSLAGAQPKTALHRVHAAGDRWGIPFGRTPTTHILKPRIPGLDGQLENEHFCLRLASALGLPSARTEVLHFDGERAIVVERYDRVPRPNGGYARVHQEDMCQALGIMPGNKYQNEGGPSIERIVSDVLRTAVAPKESIHADVKSFLSAVVLNWLILGTDAHGKNFSIIHGREGFFRFAPLYDMISALPYDDPRDVKMSLKIDGHYDFDMLPCHWERLAAAIRFDGDELLGVVRNMIAQAPDLAADITRACQKDGLTDPVIGKLPALISGRCRKVGQAYGEEALPAAREAPALNAGTVGI